MEKRTFETAPNTSICAYLTRPVKQTDKPLLLFLHYWGGTSSTWHKLTAADSPTSLTHLFPTLALDLRGWGESQHQEGAGNDHFHSVEAMASDVASILLDLKRNREQSLLENGVVLVGHSMGAKVALASLPAMTTEILHLVNGVVLIAPAPPTPLELPSEMKAQQLVAYGSVESIRWTMENVLGNPERLGNSDIDLLVQCSFSGDAFAKRAWPLYGMLEDVSPVVGRVLSSVFVKASVLVGELDIVEPRERVQTQVVDFLEKAGVKTSVTVVKGVKHLIPLEDPQAIYQAIHQL